MTLAQDISQLGYNLGLPGMGISLPVGTPYNAYQTPTGVYGGYAGPGFMQGDTTVNPTGFEATGPATGYVAPTGTPIVNNPQPQQTSGTYNFNMGDFPNYAGWDSNGAYQDWLAKGSPAPGSFGGGGSGAPAVDPYAQVRGEINSGYDNYFQSLNDQLNGYLPTQQTNQQGIVNNSYNQGVSDLGFQRDTGYQDLAKSDAQITTNQNKNLKNLDENMRNMFMAGNVYLGSRGAGDSSAANQYSYALTKLGNQARGDVTSQSSGQHAEVADKQYRLGQLYNQEVNKLSTEKDNNMLSIAQWFADSQQQIKSAVASGELSRSTDLTNLSRSLLDSALNKLNLTQTETANRRASLESWAMSTSQNLSQLKTNMAGISQYAPQGFNSQITGGQPTVDAQGNYRLPVGYNATGTTKKDQYGNIIS